MSRQLFFMFTYICVLCMWFPTRLWAWSCVNLWTWPGLLQWIQCRCVFPGCSKPHLTLRNTVLSIEALFQRASDPSRFPWSICLLRLHAQRIKLKDWKYGLHISFMLGIFTNAISILISRLSPMPLPPCVYNTIWKDWSFWAERLNF